jgi:hypothetical protein
MPNIRDILVEYNIPFAGEEHKHGRLGWVQVDCPWCGPGTGKYHLGISLSTGAASCWRCGRKNTALVLARLTGEQQRAMRERVDATNMVAAPVRKTGQLVLPPGRRPLLPGHRTYLAKRGLDPDEIAETWGVEAIGQASGAWRAYRWRLFIPVHHHGEIVSWTTRAIKKSAKQRYLSASMEQEAVAHKTLLYGADMCHHAIIIHEGPIDVWATGPGAVATCGTAYTEAQLLAMSRYPVRVVCFDADTEAQARARELADALSVFPGTTHNVELETGKDTAEADPAEVAELRATFLE